MKNLTLTLVCLLVTLSVKAESNMDGHSAIGSPDSSTSPSSDPTPAPISGPTSPSPQDPVAIVPPLAPPAVSEPPPAPPVSADPPAISEPPVVAEPPAVLDPTPSPIIEPPLPIIYGEAGYGGTGCTAGNALIDHDEHGHLTILLAPMWLDGTNSKSLFTRASCGIRIPLTVPAHSKIVIVQSLNSGDYGVDATDSLSLTQEIGFVGSNRVSQTIPLARDTDGLLSWDSSNGQVVAESSCSSTQSMLAINTNALIRKSKNVTDSYFSLDSTELQLLVVDCGE